MVFEKKIKRLLLTFILALTAIGILLLLIPQKENKRVPMSPPTEADVVIEMFHMSQSAGDRVKWELKAERAEIYKEEKKARLKNIELTFRRKPEGDIHGSIITLRGEEGILNTETRDVLIKGNIEVSTDKGYTFRTATIRWDELERRIISEDEVTLTGPNIQVTGNGVVVNVDIQRIEVLSNVRTILYRKEG